MGLCTVVGSYGELCLSGLTTSLCLLCLLSALLTQCSVCPCTTCVYISVTLPKWLMLPVLLQDLLDTLVSLQPQCSVKAGGWHEDKVLNVAADVLKEGPRSGGLRNHLVVSGDMGPLNMVLLQEAVCVRVWGGVV